jgi:hypothetical protein
MRRANAHPTTRATPHQRSAASIGTQIEELLRIRREAEETAAFRTTDIFVPGTGRSSLCTVAV